LKICNNIEKQLQPVKIEYFEDDNDPKVDRIHFEEESESDGLKFVEWENISPNMVM
jgi:hypothetical protein